MLSAMPSATPEALPGPDGSIGRDSRLLDSRVLPQCLDAVEFCPSPQFPGTFAVASYQLVECQGSDDAAADSRRSTRIGGVHLFGLDFSNADVSIAEPLFAGKEPALSLPAVRMVHHQSVSGCGVLDIKWRREGLDVGSRRKETEEDEFADTNRRRGGSHRPSMLAAAIAEGNVDLYEMKGGELAVSPPSLSLITRIPFAPSDIAEPDAKPPMCLSLDWWTAAEPEGGTGNYEDQAAKAEMEGEVDEEDEGIGETRLSWGVADRIAVSRSDGSLAVAQQGEDGAWLMEHAWPAHEFEAWTCCFNIWQPEVLYSGGDDCAMCAWDLRTHLSSSPSSFPQSLSSSSRPAWRNIKAHRAGVTSLRCSPHSPYLLASGSYDEEVRFWDVRMALKPVAVCQVATGGGVWRLKWHPEKPQIVLAACMHGGATVVSLSRGCVGAVEGVEGVPASNVESAVSMLEKDGIGSFEGLLGDVVERYEQHESMVYGVDWGRCNEALGPGSSEADGTWVVSSCSFYDKLLHLWKPSVF